MFLPRTPSFLRTRRFNARHHHCSQICNRLATQNKQLLSVLIAIATKRSVKRLGSCEQCELYVYKVICGIINSRKMTKNVTKT